MYNMYHVLIYRDICFPFSVLFLEFFGKNMIKGKEEKGEKNNKGKNYDKICHIRGENIYFPPICTAPSWGEEWGKYIPLLFYK